MRKNAIIAVTILLIFTETTQGQAKYIPHAFGIETGMFLSKTETRGETGAGTTIISSRVINIPFAIRYTRNLSPRFGIDFVKLSSPFRKNDRYSYSFDNSCFWYSGERNLASFQMLTGVRFTTPYFGKNKRSYFYTALRFGVGYFYNNRYEYTYGNDNYDNDYVYGDADYHSHLDDPYGNYVVRKRFEFCSEWDVIMLNLNRFFIGVGIKYDISRSPFSKHPFYSGPNFNHDFSFGVRAGFNLGKTHTYTTTTSQRQTTTQPTRHTHQQNNVQRNSSPQRERNRKKNVFTPQSTNLAFAKGDMSIGGSLVLSGGIGFDAKFRYNVTNVSRLEFAVTRFSEKNNIWGFSVKTALTDISLNSHYLWEINDNFVLYALGGFGIIHAKATIKNLEFKYSDSFWGLNVGGGVEYKLNRNWSINGELKFKLINGDHYYMIPLGVTYRF